MAPAMAEKTEIELLITVLVAAEDDRGARAACLELTRSVGGRVVESGDCSDEEPGCWSVTISRGGGTGGSHVAAALARSVRTFMRELAPEHALPRISCAPPTAWTVLEEPGLLDSLVSGGERILVEAWWGGSALTATPAASTSADDPRIPRP